MFFYSYVRKCFCVGSVWTCTPWQDSKHTAVNTLQIHKQINNVALKKNTSQLILMLISKVSRAADKIIFLFVRNKGRSARATYKLHSLALETLNNLKKDILAPLLNRNNQC